ncbi:MAG: hypothetical protein K1Y36_24190 [Blastocatellia bacterium]|nr:hypothetical protein [Blastocatellia bacterium]
MGCPNPLALRQECVPPPEKLAQAPHSKQALLPERGIIVEPFSRGFAPLHTLAI